MWNDILLLNKWSCNHNPQWQPDEPPGESQVIGWCLHKAFYFLSQEMWTRTLTAYMLLYLQIPMSKSSGNLWVGYYDWFQWEWVNGCTIFILRWNITWSQTLNSSHSEKKTYSQLMQIHKELKESHKRKRAKAHSIGLSTQPYFDTLQGRSSPNVPNWDLTSAGAEQILASWVALGPVIYLHPIEPLSSRLLPQPRTPQGVREPVWTLHTDGWRRLSFPSFTSTSKIYNNRSRVRNRLEAVGKHCPKAFVSSHNDSNVY